MRIKVKVTPSAKKETVRKISDSSLEVKVREPAERGVANRRVVELVAAHFAVSASNVRILSGHKSPRKILKISDG